MIALLAFATSDQKSLDMLELSGVLLALALVMLAGVALIGAVGGDRDSAALPLCGLYAPRDYIRRMRAPFASAFSSSHWRPTSTPPSRCS